MAYNSTTAGYYFFKPSIRSSDNMLNRQRAKSPPKNLWIILAGLSIFLMFIIALLGYFWLRDRRPNRRVDAAERGQANVQTETRYQRNLRLAVEREISANRAAPSYPLDDIPRSANRQYHNPGFEERNMPAPCYVRGLTDPLGRSTSQHMPPLQQSDRTAQQLPQRSSQKPVEPRSLAPGRSMKPADRLRAKMNGDNRL